MAKVFKFFADFSAITKAYAAQERLNGALATNNKLAKAAAKSHAEAAKHIDKSVKKLKQAENIGQQKSLSEMFRAKATSLGQGRQPIEAGMFKGLALVEGKLGLVTKALAFGKVAAMGFGKALLAIGKLSWIGVLTTAIFIFKRVWDANIGGIQTAWSRVMGRVLDVWGRVTAAFYGFVERVGPAFAGFFNGLVDLVIPVIDAVGNFATSLLNSGEAVGAIGNTFQPIFDGLTKVIKTVIGVLSDLGKDIFSTGKTGQSAFGQVFQSIGLMLGGFLEALNAVIKFNQAIGTFKVLGFIIKTIGYALQGLGVILFGLFKATEFLATGLTKMLGGIWEFLQPLIEGLSKALDLASALGKFSITNIFGSEEQKQKAADEVVKSVKAVSASPEESAARQTLNQRTTTINNNPTVTVNSVGAITPANAPLIGDTLARSVMVSRGVL